MSVDLENLDIDKPIVLVGMMGCGKSAIGEKLADTMGLTLYDVDAMIVDDEEKSISDIFKDDGEAYFREVEKNKIAELLVGGRCIISTGGGALTTPATLENVKAQGVSIWLHTDIDTTYERIKHDKNRPLLDCEDPKEKLMEISAAREHLYKQANIHVDNSGDAEDTIAEIIKEIKK